MPATEETLKSSAFLAVLNGTPHSIINASSPFVRIYPFPLELLPKTISFKIQGL